MTKHTFANTPEISQPNMAKLAELAQLKGPSWIKNKNDQAHDCDNCKQNRHGPTEHGTTCIPQLTIQKQTILEEKGNMTKLRITSKT